jgi:hypothetical protein
VLAPLLSIVIFSGTPCCGQLGVRLFERSGRHPALTAQGKALLNQARAVAAGRVGRLAAETFAMPFVVRLKLRAHGLKTAFTPNAAVLHGGFEMYYGTVVE